MLRNEIEKSLKRYLKKKVSYSFALLIGFLITGEISAGADTAGMLEIIRSERATLLERIRANENRIGELDKEIVELLKEGDYYAKTLDESKQFFFPLTWEHRHSHKYRRGGEPTSIVPVTPPPEIPEYITPQIPEVSTNPELPVVTIPEIKFEIGDITPPSAGPDHGEIQQYTPEFEFNIVAPGTIEVQAIKPEVATLVIPNVEPGIIVGPTELNPVRNAQPPEVTYEPRYVTIPENFKISPIDARVDIDMPVINVAAGSGSQGNGGWDTVQTYTAAGQVAIMFDDYDGYRVVEVDERTGEVKLNETTGEAELGKLVVNIDRDSQDASNIQGKFQLGVYDENNKENVYKKENILDLTNTNFNHLHETAYFISDTLAVDTVVQGEYEFHVKNKDLITLISLNPAAIGSQANNVGYDTTTGTILGQGLRGSQHIVSGDSAIRVKTMEVGKTKDDTVITMYNGEIKNGEIVNAASAMVGIEHQEWDIIGHYEDGTKITGDNGKKFIETYSVLWNKATIKMDSGKQMIGIVIDVEHSSPDQTVYGSDTEVYRKKYNNKTINDGEIIIGKDARESVGISYELEKRLYKLNANDAADISMRHLRDDSYLGKITIDGTSSYGFRIAKGGEYFSYSSSKEDEISAKKKVFDDIRVFGNTAIEMEQGKIGEKEVDIDKDTLALNGKTIANTITVNGSNNIGVSIGKSLSDEAAGYLEKGTAKWETAGGTIESGYFLRGNQTGYEKGKVNPIANIHNLNIVVNGDNSIGFLRNRDYSNNNENDMIIEEGIYQKTDENGNVIKDPNTNEPIDVKYGAIDSITFGADASGSVLIRSDMYGITLNKKLEVNNPTDEGAKNTTPNTDGNDKNIVMQATIGNWTAVEEVKSNQFLSKGFLSIGDVTNKSEITGNMDNLIGMAASGIFTRDGYEYLNQYLGKDINGNKIEEKKDKIGENDTPKALIVNNGKIELTGKNSVGMIVLDDNAGILKGESADNKAVVSVKTDKDMSDANDYNVGIYNTGTFTIENANISVNGSGSAAIYNFKTKTEEQEQGDTKPYIASYDTTGKLIIKEGTNITIGKGSTGIVNNGGTVLAENGFTLKYDAGTDTSIDANTKAIYSEGGKIYIGVNEKGEITKDNNSTTITINNGGAGIVARDGAEINIANADITYSGNGYALYTNNNGKINFIGDGTKTNSTLNLGGSAFGMEINVNDSNNQSINLKGLAINVTSNNVTVFNMVSTDPNGQAESVSTLLGNVTKQVENAAGIKITDIKADENIDGYKIAMIENGTMSINQNISQSDKENGTDEEKTGFFYFKRFVGQRIRTTVEEDIKVDSTLGSDKAEKYFGGQIVGLEANSSGNAKDNTEASITLEKGSTVIANRLDGDKATYKGAIGLYSNFGTITLNSGSNVKVEVKDEDNDTVFDEGVGIYAVNGSKVVINGAVKDKDDPNKVITAAANVTVAGNKAVGIYGLAYRNNLSEGQDKNEFGYTYEDDGTTIKDNKGQGKVEIINAGDVNLDGKGSVGIYVVNNNDETVDGNINRENAKVTNTGNIVVGGALDDGTDSTKYVSSVGIYTSGGIISNTGSITVGSTENTKNIGGIGIAAVNSKITDLGTITLGNYSTGISLDKDSTIELGENSEKEVMFKSLGENNATQRIGILYNGEGAETKLTDTIDFNVDMSAVAGGKAVVALNRDVELEEGKNVTVSGENGRGMVALTEGIVTNSGTIEVGAKTDTVNKVTNGSIGMLAMEKNGIVNNQGTINVNSAKGIGIYVTNDTSERSENQVTGIGNINLKSTNNIGLFIDGFESQKLGSNVLIGEENINMAGATDSIGVYAAKGTKLAINMAINQEAKENLGNGNILLYGAGDGTVITNNRGITVSNSYNTTNEKGEEVSIETVKDDKKNIGVYLDTLAKYEGNGVLRVEKGALGLYANVGKDGRTFDDKLNVVVDSQGKDTIGIVLKGDTDVKGNETVKFAGGTITLNNSDTGSYSTAGENKAIGIYADGVNVNVEDKITIKHGEKEDKKDGSNGTGIYLTNGAVMTGGGTVNITGHGVSIKDENGNVTYPASVGIFYSAETKDGNNIVTSNAAGDTNNVNLNIQKDSTIGIYTAKDLTNIGDITVERGTANGQVIGIYGSGTDITQQGNISLEENSIGIYNDGGTVTLAKVNDSTESTITTNSKSEFIDLSEEGKTEAQQKEQQEKYDNYKVSVGIYAQNVTVSENATINVTGAKDIGVYASGTVTNTGTINVGENSISGTGVYLAGKDASFNGSFNGENGEVNVKTTDKNSRAGIGIYLKDDAKLVSTGTLTLGKGDIGIYALDSDITNDEVKIDISGSTGAIAVVGATTRDKNGNPVKVSDDPNETEYKETLLNDLDITIGQDSVGIYAQDTGVKISNVTIDATDDENINDDSDDNTSSTGIYLQACEYDTTKGHEHKPYEISDSNITIVKGVGILLGSEFDEEEEKDPATKSDTYAQLNLSGTTINVNSYVEQNEAETGIGVYVQKGGILNSSTVEDSEANTYNVKNGIGVYGAESSKINLGKDNLNLYGYSVGVFSNEGDIVLGKDVTATFQDRSEDDEIVKKQLEEIGTDSAAVEEFKESLKLQGSVAYAINGDITSAMNINTTGVSVDDLPLEPKPDVDGVAGATLRQRADKFTALLGKYTDGNKHTIENTGTISIVGNSAIGIAAIGDENGHNAENKITNTGNIYISGWTETEADQSNDNASNNDSTQQGKMAVGIYSTNASIENSGVITVGDNAAGIYYNSQNGYNISSIKLSDEKTGEINLYGTGGVGTFLTGKAGNVTLNTITSSSERNLGLHLDDFTAKNFTFKSISLGNNSMGIYATGENTNIKIAGIDKDSKIEVGDATGENGGAIGVYAEDNAKLDVTGVENITVGEGGTAVYVKGAGADPNNLTAPNTTVTVQSLDKLHVGAGNGALIYAEKGGHVILDKVLTDSSKALEIDGHFGIVLSDQGYVTTTNKTDSDINFQVVNGGVGIAIAGKTTGYLDLGLTNGHKVNIEVQNGVKDSESEEDRAAKYSVGVYYKDAKDFSPNQIQQGMNTVNIIQKGEYTTGLVFENSYGTISNNITLGSEENEENSPTNSIGMIIRNNQKNMFTLTGDITVNGEGNIGVGARDSDLTTDGTITTGKGTKNDHYPIGVYLVHEQEESDKTEFDYDYKGTGALKVGDYGTGILGRNYDITYSGAINVGTSAIGIYGIGENKTIDINVTGNIAAGTTTTSGSGGIGVYGIDANIIVNNNSVVLGTTESLDNNNGNIGILSKGKGDVTYNATNTTINGTPLVIKEQNTNSIGIYKEGTGTITVNGGSWNIGNNAMGIAVSSEKVDSAVEITSNVAMTLKDGAIGIYAHGSNTVSNSGNITVGKTIVNEETGDTINSSVGIYMANEFSRDTATGTNTGTITVSEGGSVGVQAVGNVEFTNAGTINVSNGGVGAYATHGATIINAENGIITLEGDNSYSVGMYASGTSTSSTGKASTIINKGTINANSGIGMYIDNGAVLENTGKITVTNGIGILGKGDIKNTGTITVTGTGKDVSDGTLDELKKAGGAIVVVGPDTVQVNSNYHAGIGGILETAGNLKLNDTMVNIANNNFGFDALGTISGSIKLDPELAVSGNGYSFKLPEAIVDNNIDVKTFPLYEQVTIDDEVYIQKVDYKEIAKDSQYNALYDGLDETLKGATGASEVLKKLNQTLGSLYYSDPGSFYSTYNTAMEEAKGNMYSHVQSRMQDINRAFDNSFDEMEQSFNFSKDTDKFSVIYTNGDYKNSNSELANYDYNIAGLMYMKEYEGVDYNNKYGYTFGLTGSKFKFDDLGSSEEKVISLRAGVHNVKDFGDGLNLLTKGEVGYNRHMAERKLAILGTENDADYNSYHISLENKFRKTLYQNLENEVGAYVSLDLEYGKFDDIKEDGDIALKVKGNDYFSSKVKAGLTGTGRIYLGDDWTMKVTGDAGYSYDLGDNYSANEAKVKNTDTGYYSLMSEVKSRDRVYAKAGVGFERLNYMGVTLEGEAARDFRRDEDYWRVSLRFNYKFGKVNATKPKPPIIIPDISMSADSYFDFDKYELKPEGREKIREASDLINRYDAKGTLIIEGHTDWTGSIEYNQRLSERRAASVEQEFRRNINKQENVQYDTKGYGELRPIATNHTKEGRAKNRRVDIKFDHITGQGMETKGNTIVEKAK